jgi:hypothetical protein
MEYEFKLTNTNPLMGCNRVIPFSVRPIEPYRPFCLTMAHESGWFFNSAVEAGPWLSRLYSCSLPALEAGVVDTCFHPFGFIVLSLSYVVWVVT